MAAAAKNLDANAAASCEMLQGLSPCQLQQIKDALDKDLAEKSLAEFVRQSWHVLEPGTPYLPNWHIDLICEYLEAVARGDVNRLIINIPPRYGKSLLTSIMWPCWLWATRPESRWIFASYSLPLSYKLSVDRRTLLLSDWYQSRWGADFKLSEDLNMKSEFGNSRRGQMVASSVGGTLTGKGGNFLVVDDPLHPLEALSDADRERANTWFSQTLSSRLDDKRKGAIVIIMQRLHEMDLSGYLLESSDDWVHLQIPAIADEKQEYRFPITGRTIVREPGDLLWAEREGLEEIEKQRTMMGAYAFSGQYLQQPVPSGGALFKHEWLRYYKELPNYWGMIISPWDCAFSARASYVVGQVWGRNETRNYLLDQVRGKWDFPQTISMMRDLNSKWPLANGMLIEEKANGSALISILKNEIGGVIPVNPHGSKEARAAAVTPLFESGKVFLPDPQIEPWVADYASEILKFPGGSHDDQVDATSQALAYIEEKYREITNAKIRSSIRAIRTSF